MTDPAKVRRHAERIKELVAEVLRTQVKDPRVGMITITSARITADLRDATVFYTVLGDAAAMAGTAAALDSAKGLVRSTVGRALGLRHSPTLAFVPDEVPDHARHIDELLDAARESDARVHQIAAGASYAGESQPYRVASDEDDRRFRLESGLADDDAAGDRVDRHSAASHRDSAASHRDSAASHRDSAASHRDSAASHRDSAASFSERR